MKPLDTDPANQAGHNKSLIPRFRRPSSLRALQGEVERSKAERRLSTPDSFGRPLSRLSSYESQDGAGWKDRNGTCFSTTSSVNGDVPHQDHPTEGDATDTCSVKSYGSCATFMSCDVPSLRRGMADRPESRNDAKQKYVLHCQRHVHTQEEYLTPTQRKDRQIRQLKAALVRATRSLEKRDMEIERLKAEVERIRMTVEQNANGSGCSSPTIQPPLPKESQIFSSTMDSHSSAPDKSDMSSSRHLEDSGILSDMTDGNGPSDCRPLLQDSPRPDGRHRDTQDVDKNALDDDHWPRYSMYKFPDYASFRDKILRDLRYDDPVGLLVERDEQDDTPGTNASTEYKKELEETKRRHSTEFQELKEKYNDRIENLLQKLSEANTRYSELRPLYDRAQDRIRQLENQVSELKKEMAAQEEWHSQMYLKMYRKGQEAAKFEHADEVLEFAHRAPKRVSVPELLQQLHRAEHELEETKQMYRCELYKRATAAKGNDRQAEYTLKFLKDAVYYFLTEKDNRGHLRAIESILGFTDTERMNVAKSLKNRRL